MTTATTQVSHFLPGRLRMKSGKVKANIPLAREIERTLAGYNGIHHVEANPVTGSVLVLYEPGAPEALAALMACTRTLGLSPHDRTLEHLEDWLRASAAGANPGLDASLAAGVTAFFRSLDASVAQATGHWGDLRSLVPLTLFLLGLRSLLVAEKVVFPNWYDFFWFAFSTFIVLNPPRSTAG
jgi:hypothetical protein